VVVVVVVVVVGLGVVVVVVVVGDVMLRVELVVVGDVLRVVARSVLPFLTVPQSYRTVTLTEGSAKVQSLIFLSRF